MTTQIQGKNLTTAINNLHKANNPQHIQDVIVSVIFSVLHGNTDPLNRMLGSEQAIKETPADIRGFMGKMLKGAVSKNKDKSYKQSREGIEAKLVELGLEAKPDFEAVSNAIPFWKPETEKTKQEFDAIAAAKRLLAKAEKAKESGEFKGDAAILCRLIDTLKPFNV